MRERCMQGCWLPEQRRARELVRFDEYPRAASERPRRADRTATQAYGPLEAIECRRCGTAQSGTHRISGSHRTETRWQRCATLLREGCGFACRLALTILHRRGH